MRLLSLAPRAFAAVLALLGVGGCARMIEPVDLPTMTFEKDVPPIDGSIEICVRPKFHKRQWNVKEHPYIIELGKRAAISFERMGKTAFRDAVAVYTDACGSTSDTPWIEATIVSAKRDYDGFQGGVTEQDPVDTALTMEFSIHADDGSEIWATSIETQHRSVDPMPYLGTRSRRLRGSRDFGVVLREAFDQAYQELVRSPDVRAAFGDLGLEAKPEDEAIETESGPDVSASLGFPPTLPRSA